ncbi:hypothetical protein OAN95_06495 [Alphaproteobacteria bacterium]|nr:hypothetical protein [Alphaproteobacteria bacterium]
MRFETFMNGLLAFLFMTSVCTNAIANDKNVTMADITSLMVISMVVVGKSAYCHKYISPNSDYIDATKEWNERNNEQMMLVVKAAEALGGLPKRTKSMIDRKALQVVKRQLDASENKVHECDMHVWGIKNNFYDLEVHQVTADKIKRLKSLKLD